MMYKVTIFERYTQPTIRWFITPNGCYDVQSYNFWKIYTTPYMRDSMPKLLLWCTKLQFLKDIHNSSVISNIGQRVVMMYKVTIFERYTQLCAVRTCWTSSCYDVQSYNFWKIYTTAGVLLVTLSVLLWCTKLQFLKDIHNLFTVFMQKCVVVMMYKVTIFERYTQLGRQRCWRSPRCYDVQSYNFWKIYTTHWWCCMRLATLLWCTKLQFLKDIHNIRANGFWKHRVVMMYKVTIFERYTQPVAIDIDGHIGCYDVQSYNFWKIYTTGLRGVVELAQLLWCTKLQFLKDIHNYRYT